MIDIKKIKTDFPIFANQKNLVYLDSAATSLKPQKMIDAMNEYYTNYTANIHRGIYKNAEKATAEYEKVRGIVAQLLNSSQPSEISFSKNATESLNLLAYGLGETLKERDEIVITIAEHHANFVTWQQIALKKKVKLRIVLVDVQGNCIGEYGKPLEKSWNWTDILSKKTKIISIAHVSNVLGVIFPVADIFKTVKSFNQSIVCIVDGCQAIPHMKVDVKQLKADAYVFSSHKILGPTGVGVLWTKKELAHNLPPFLYGGDMIREVNIHNTIFQDPPNRFEAGTSPIAEVIGLGAAIKYLTQFSFTEIHKHESELISYMYRSLKEAFSSHISILGPSEFKPRAGLISFSVKDIHPHDIAQVLDQRGVAIRAGHHCAMPIHTYLGLVATSRASVYIYNTKQDIDLFIKSLHAALQLFS